MFTILLLICYLALTSSVQRTVVVAGASGRVGREVVRALLSSTLPGGTSVKVKALARNVGKAKEILSGADSRLEFVACDLQSRAQVESAMKGADACIWCASGFSDRSSKLDQLLGILKLKFFPATVIDVSTVAQIASLLRESSSAQGLVNGGPKFVLCSSAGVTRPAWSEAKKTTLVGAADIPIVRLNPLNILGVKCEGEKALRESGVPYAVVRPCGLNDKWPQGRAVLSQNDVAVGRANKMDVARVIVDCLASANATFKTFECFSLAGYAYPRDMDLQFSRLTPDKIIAAMSEVEEARMCQVQYQVSVERY